MYHMFDVAVAVRFGVNAAILFQNIAYWCEHSRANGKNYYDGLYWTFNSVKALQELFPYMSASQINTAMKKLVDAGLVVKGNYNRSAYDRTIWYAVTKIGKSIYENSEMDFDEIENQFAANRKPIPDINTDVNTDINTNESRRKPFTPPTVDDVSAYAREMGFTIDAQRFVDYNESRGWMMGKARMKNWKAAVRTWVSRDREQTSTTSPTSTPTVYTDPDYENCW